MLSRSAALAQQAALQMPFSSTTPLVKMRLERSAERDKREIINILSAEYVQSAAEHIQNRPASRQGLSVQKSPMIHRGF